MAGDEVSLPHIFIYINREFEWSWLNFVVTWLKISKPNDSTKKLGQMTSSQVTCDLKNTTPFRDCGASEETAIHLFLNGKFHNEFRPQKNDKLNLLCKDDCDEMEKFIMETKKLNKDEEA